MMAGIFSGGLLFGLDTTIAADVQGPIFERFGEIEKLPWVGIGFPLGSVAVILLVGKLFGTFEIKWLLIGSFLLFEAGSALCGGAPTLNALIVGRVIAGVGGAGMYIGSLNYVGVFTTDRERPLYNALIGLCWGCGAILGPVIGGAFSVNPNTTWRWAFYINLPLAAAQSPIFFFAFPKFNPRPDEAGLSKLKTIDWAGATLNATTFVFLIVALTFSGSLWAWDEAGPITFWVLTGVSAILYALQQAFSIFTTPEQRLFPVQFLKSRTMVLLYLVTSVAGTSAGVTIYYIPLLFQFTRGDSALQAAVRLLPYIIPYVVFMMVAGGLLPVLGRYAPFYALGGALILAGAAAMYVIDQDTSVAKIYGFEILLAVGAGITFQNGYAVAGTIAQNTKELAEGIVYINVAQIGSMAVALSMAGNIFQNVGYDNLRAALAQYNLPDAVIRGALGGAASAVSNGPPEMRALAIGAIVHTVGDVFALVMAGGALMLVCSFFLKWEKLAFDMSRAAA